VIRIFFLLLVFSSTIVASERQYSELSNSDSSGVYRAHGTDTPFVYMEKFNEDFTTSIIRKDLRDSSERIVIDSGIVSSPLFEIDRKGLAVFLEGRSKLFYLPPTKNKKVLIFDSELSNERFNRFFVNEQRLIVWSTSEPTGNEGEVRTKVYQYRVPMDRIERENDFENVTVRHEWIQSNSGEVYNVRNVFDNGYLLLTKSHWDLELNSYRSQLGIMDKSQNFRLIDSDFYNSVRSHVFGSSVLYYEYEYGGIPKIYKKGGSYSFPTDLAFIPSMNEVFGHQTSLAGITLISLRDYVTEAIEKLVLWNGENIVATINAKSGTINDSGDVAYLTNQGEAFILFADGSLEALTPELPDGNVMLTPIISNDGVVYIGHVNHNASSEEEFLESTGVLKGEIPSVREDFLIVNN